VPLDGGGEIQVEFLAPDEAAYEAYYNVIANPLLWFLQHSMWDVPRAPIIDRATWQAWEGYRAVNLLFADAIARQVRATARRTLVMLQDYHLYLVAERLRATLRRRERPTTLHFVHIPWPGPEYWRILPPGMRQPILHSLCAVDVLGFQTAEDRLNFLRTCESMLPQAAVNFRRGRRGLRPRLIVSGPPDPHEPASADYFHALQARRKELDLEEEIRFVFESGSDPEQGLTIDLDLVGDLYRTSDLMLMPSHREGFAIPVLEAGLLGIPVVSTAVPAAVEIGGQDIILFDEQEPPARLAERLLAWSRTSQVHRLRRRVRQNYTWQAIFQHQIRPCSTAARPSAPPQRRAARSPVARPAVEAFSRL